MKFLLIERNDGVFIYINLEKITGFWASTGSETIIMVDSNLQILVKDTPGMIVQKIKESIGFTINGNYV